MLSVKIDVDGWLEQAALLEDPHREIVPEAPLSRRKRSSPANANAATAMVDQPPRKKKAKLDQAATSKHQGSASFPCALCLDDSMDELVGIEGASNLFAHRICVSLISLSVSVLRSVP